MCIKYCSKSKNTNNETKLRSNVQIEANVCGRGICIKIISFYFCKSLEKSCPENQFWSGKHQRETWHSLPGSKAKCKSYSLPVCETHMKTWCLERQQLSCTRETLDKNMKIWKAYWVWQGLRVGKSSSLELRSFLLLETFRHVTREDHY